MRLLVATPLTLDHLDSMEECFEGEPVYWNTACTHPGPLRTIGSISLGCECDSGFTGIVNAGFTDVAVVVDEPRMTGAHYLAFISASMIRDTGGDEHARSVALSLMAHAKNLGTGAVVCRRRGEYRHRRPYSYLPRLLESFDDLVSESPMR